jgi:hypothetical protein
MNEQDQSSGRSNKIQLTMDKFKSFFCIRNLIWLLIIVFLYLYLNLFRNALIDDAFITLTYVKSILTSRTWGFFPGYVTNTATSPLNVLFQSFFGIFVGPTITASILATLTVLVLMTKTLINISVYLFKNEIFGYLGAVGFIFNPLLISTIGLESFLFATLFLVSIYCYLTKKWNRLAVVLGLLTLTRTEGVLFFVIFLIFSPIQMKIRFSGIYLLSIAPWYLFSWIYLGSIIPDTFFIKVGQSLWVQTNLIQGVPLYFQRFPFETSLSFSYILLILYPNKHVRKLPVILVIIILAFVHFISYSVLGVWPFHWYYTPLITAIILIGILNLGSAYQNAHPRSWQAKIIRGILAIYLIIPIVGMIRFLAQDQFIVKEMPIHTNWATHEQFKEIGLWIKDMGLNNGIDLKGEIGTIGYYCECYLLDEISNREWAQEVIDVNSTLSGLGPFMVRLNFRFYSENPTLPEKE